MHYYNGAKKKRLKISFGYLSNFFHSDLKILKFIGKEFQIGKYVCKEYFL